MGRFGGVIYAYSINYNEKLFFFTIWQKTLDTGRLMRLYSPLSRFVLLRRVGRREKPREKERSMNPRLKVCVALSALALSAMLPAAAERGADGFLDRAESALREEARSFHEDVTSSNRWREWALHRANGEETDVQGWLSSRWEETPVRLADGYAASLADWAAADLRESDWVETLDFSFQLPIEGRSGRLNVSAIGPLARGLGGGDGVLGWQVPLAAGAADDGNTELSGNVGLFYRQVLGGSGLAGLNVFGDYQDEGFGREFLAVVAGSGVSDGVGGCLCESLFSVGGFASSAGFRRGVGADCVFSGGI